MNKELDKQKLQQADSLGDAIEALTLMKQELGLTSMFAKVERVDNSTSISP